jgi:hypothetical protein
MTIKQSRTEQARTIIQARWGMADPPPADDPEVQYLLRSNETMANRYAQALKLLGKDKEAL